MPACDVSNVEEDLCILQQRLGKHTASAAGAVDVYEKSKCALAEAISRHTSLAQTLGNKFVWEQQALRKKRQVKAPVYGI